MTKFSTRQLVILAVFGALWGVVEVSLGSVLHAIKVPMSGPLLAGLGLMLAIMARSFVPKRGSTFFIGLIAMILKLFSIGSIVLGPMVAILMEALVAEVVLSFFNDPSRLSYVLAGGLGVLWNLAHPFVTGPLLFGRALISVWLDTLDTGSRLLGIPPGAIFAILGLLALLHLFIGGAAGWLSWDVGRLLHARLRGAQSSTAFPVS